MFDREYASKSQYLTYTKIVITTNKTDLKLSRLTSETCKLTSEISQSHILEE